MIRHMVLKTDNVLIKIFNYCRKYQIKILFKCQIFKNEKQGLKAYCNLKITTLSNLGLNVMS